MLETSQHLPNIYQHLPTKRARLPNIYAQYGTSPPQGPGEDRNYRPPQRRQTDDNAKHGVLFRKPVATYQGATFSRWWGHAALLRTLTAPLSGRNVLFGQHPAPIKPAMVVFWVSGLTMSL
jgi:hypothetical protein